MPEKKPDLLRVTNLKRYFTMKNTFLKKNRQYLTAVDGVTFSIKRGETFGLVGESGCGKSTIGRTIIRLYEPTGGRIHFDDHDLTEMKQNELFPFRKRMQMIFQDPYASLNTRMTVAEIIGEGMETHGLASGAKRVERIQYLLNTVGLKKEHANRYPHEFSGGQRQRIGIARALAVEPELIICDEPISALDVSIQAQVVNMLEDLQEKMGLTYLFIAHDLSMVKHISDRIGVMYLGKLMEVCASNELYDNPLHPYTQALLSSIPVPDPRLNKVSKRIILQGDVKSPINPPPGCRFNSRCRLCQDICNRETPELIEVKPDHFVACHLVKKA
ncbi:MAG: ATP-binding cassette domain-containing protein [Spirochaetes bacterium]|nr:ATP-binding cassette domain-containing protein [Spirochaetota bacterium]MBU0957098.1 ATP-binding cassette domain-containing protein [Spirochaetota bacterium]